MTINQKQKKGFTTIDTCVWVAACGWDERVDANTRGSNNQAGKSKFDIQNCNSNHMSATTIGELRSLIIESITDWNLIVTETEVTEMRETAKRLSNTITNQINETLLNGVIKKMEAIAEPEKEMTRSEIIEQGWVMREIAKNNEPWAKKTRQKVEALRWIETQNLANLMYEQTETQILKEANRTKNELDQLQQVKKPTQQQTERRKYITELQEKATSIQIAHKPVKWGDWTIVKRALNEVNAGNPVRIISIDEDIPVIAAIYKNHNKGIVPVVNARATRVAVNGTDRNTFQATLVR